VANVASILSVRETRSGEVPASVEAGEEAQVVERSLLAEGLRIAEEEALVELERVRARLGRAVEAALAGDALAAEAVLEGSGESDRRYDRLHDHLMGLIARQSPVAGDLRLAIALLHVNERVTRMSAQCDNIATHCCAMPAGARPSDGQLDCLRAMADLADEQVAEARRVFAERDAEGAARLRVHDAGINERNRRCFSLAVHDEGDEAHREAAFFVALTARAIERIGDNAVDIGQQTVFAVSGSLRGGAGG
jgi:phosphate transport system protein